MKFATKNLKTELFISRRISLAKENKSISFVFIRIAAIASALSLIVMLMSVSVLVGFKQSIEHKLTGFGSHIIVSKHDANYSFETNPINKSQKIIDKIKSVKGVSHVQSFAVKAGLVKTKNDTYGVVLKGIGKDYDWSFIDENLVRGRHLTVSSGTKTGKEVIISENMARRFAVDTGDNLYMYFIEEQARMRKYKIVGIYNSALSEFDKIYVFADIHDVEKLNNWNYKNNEQISGYEVSIDNFKDIDDIAEKINAKVGIQFDENGEKLNVMTIKDLYPQIFTWLGLLNMNAVVLLVIMAVVASINMITALLVMIMDRTKMIGILKALGATNKSVRNIFIYNGLIILGKGMIWGNLITFAVIALQRYTHFLPLNPQIYYINYVPLVFDWLNFLLINIAMIVITFAVLLLPAILISKIQPVKAIRFN